MNLTVRDVWQIAAGLAMVVVASGVGVFFAAQPAGAPQMVANELAAQRALGYHPCEPTVGQIPAEENPDGTLLGDAGGTGPGEHCEIRFAASVPADALDWVAWHEVAHLSTLNTIYADPKSSQMQDPAHCHPLFLELIAQGPTENGGYGPEYCADDPYPS